MNSARSMPEPANNMDEALSETRQALAPFAVGETFQISDRGAVALAEVDPDPWWPAAIHRVRITPPQGEAFEAEAHVQGLRSREGGERMALLLVHVAQPSVPPGSVIVSQGHTPLPHALRAPEPFAQAPRRWWQFWK